MSAHQFLVTVDVDGWNATDDRRSAQYALAAITMASLPDAGQLDGYADLDAGAHVSDVEPLP